MRAPTLLTLLPFLLAPHVSAWGELGHRTVAAIAQQYLTYSAQEYVASILLPNESLVSVATWADEVRNTSVGKWSREFHFIDADDDPPYTCNVTYKRDCNNNSCVVSAIHNYTSRLLTSSPPLSDSSRNEALKFLTHFLGDITQPLHNEHKALGGNLINVTFNAKPTKLHQLWDYEMINNMTNGKTPEGWASVLIAKMEEGFWMPGQKKWTGCLNVKKSEECALEWANDSNKWVCDYVLKEGREGVEGKELGGAYFQGAKRVIEQQVLKGGVRLAGWLNGLAEEEKRRYAEMQGQEELKV